MPSSRDAGALDASIDGADRLSDRAHTTAKARRTGIRFACVRAVPDSNGSDRVPQPPSVADWTEPGAHPVAPNVWRIPAVLPLDGLKAVNIYALVDGDGLTLIDAGWALDAARKALVDGLAQIGAGLGD